MITRPSVYSSALLLRGNEQATSASPLVQPRRGQQSSAAAVVVPKVGGAKPVSAAGGRLNNAAEFAVTKLDHLVNWGRRVNIVHTM